MGQSENHGQHRGAGFLELGPPVPTLQWEVHAGVFPKDAQIKAPCWVPHTSRTQLVTAPDESSVGNRERHSTDGRPKALPRPRLCEASHRASFKL